MIRMRPTMPAGFMSAPESQRNLLSAGFLLGQLQTIYRFKTDKLQLPTTLIPRWNGELVAGAMRTERRPPKRQRTGAVQNLADSPAARLVARASWSAVVLYRF